MKTATVIFLAATTLAGCAGQKGSMPMLDGAERVPINKHIPTTAPGSTNIQPESNHVRK